MKSKRCLCLPMKSQTDLHKGAVQQPAGERRSQLRSAALCLCMSLCCGLFACDSSDETAKKNKHEQHSVVDAAAAVDAAADTGSGPENDGPTYTYGDWGDPFAGLPSGDEQLAKVCES